MGKWECVSIVHKAGNNISRSLKNVTWYVSRASTMAPKLLIEYYLIEVVVLFSPIASRSGTRRHHCGTNASQADASREDVQHFEHRGYYPVFGRRVPLPRLKVELVDRDAEATVMGTSCLRPSLT